MAKREDAAVQRIVADDPTTPALLDKAVARHHRRAGRGEGDKHLSDPRLKLAAFAVHGNLAMSRADAQSSQIKV